MQQDATTNGHAPDEWVPIAQLKPWPRNPKKHDARSTSLLAAGMRRFGFLVPLTVRRSDGTIAAGHGRLLALQAILRESPSFVPSNAPVGTLPGSVPVLWADFETQAQFEAFVISDNQHPKNAPTDDEAIANLLRDMDRDGLGLDGIGFSDEWLDQLVQHMPDLDPDALGDSTDHLAGESEFMIWRMSTRKDEEAEIKDAVQSDWGDPEAPSGQAERLGALFLHLWRTHGR